jgi:hypothetical protein
MPQTGEHLLLSDGRRFVLTAVENELRGWWFRAVAEDRATVLQGNMRLEWDPQGQVWRLAGTVTRALYHLHAHAPYSRQKQRD